MATSDRLKLIEARRNSDKNSPTYAFPSNHFDPQFCDNDSSRKINRVFDLRGIPLEHSQGPCQGQFETQIEQYTRRDVEKRLKNSDRIWEP